MARVDDAACIENRPLTLIDLEPGILLAREEEIAHVKARLKADDISSQRTLENRVAHWLGQHLPVLRRRPRHMHEVLQHHPRQRLSHQPRNQIQLVVVDEDQGLSRRFPGDLDRLGGHLAVDLDVTLRPGLMDAVVDDGFVTEVPEVVLDEPEHGVREHPVVHVVLLLGGHRVVQPARRIQQRSEEHTSELQSHLNLVCRLLLEKKKERRLTPRNTLRVLPVRYYHHIKCWRGLSCGVLLKAKTSNDLIPFKIRLRSRISNYRTAR